MQIYYRRDTSIVEKQRKGSSTRETKDSITTAREG